MKSPPSDVVVFKLSWYNLNSLYQVWKMKIFATYIIEKYTPEIALFVI